MIFLLVLRKYGRKATPSSAGLLIVLPLFTHFLSHFSLPYEFMKLLHEPVRNKQWLSAGEKHLSMPGAQETSSTQVGFQAAV